jgi:predicted extracellular nuclease
VTAGDPNPNYQPYLVEGNDPGGIDVGFLVKTPKVNVISVTQYGKTNTYTDPTDGSTDILNDRPPLVLKASVTRAGAGASLPITVIVNHLRSLTDVDNPTSGPRIRRKRELEAEFLANLIQGFQTSDPGANIVSIGDYNAFQFNDGYVDVMGVVKGTPAPANQVLEPDTVITNPALADLIDTASADQKYSYSFGGSAQELDHIVVNNNMLPRVSRYAVARNDADFPEVYRNDPNRPERISDHDMPVGYFNLPTGVDVTGSVSVTQTGFGRNRLTGIWAADMTVTNTGVSSINGPVNVVLTNLPANVTMTNQTGIYNGSPYITVSAGTLAPGASATVSIQFTNPSNGFINYTPVTYSGLL